MQYANIGYALLDTYAGEIHVTAGERVTEYGVTAGGAHRWPLWWMNARCSRVLRAQTVSGKAAAAVLQSLREEGARGK